MYACSIQCVTGLHTCERVNLVDLGRASTNIASLSADYLLEQRKMFGLSHTYTSNAIAYMSSMSFNNPLVKFELMYMEYTSEALFSIEVNASKQDSRFY